MFCNNLLCCYFSLCWFGLNWSPPATYSLWYFLVWCWSHGQLPWQRSQTSHALPSLLIPFLFFLFSELDWLTSRWIWCAEKPSPKSASSYRCKWNYVDYLNCVLLFSFVSFFPRVWESTFLSSQEETLNDTVSTFLPVPKEAPRKQPFCSL